MMEEIVLSSGFLFNLAPFCCLSISIPTGINVYFCITRTVYFAVNRFYWKKPPNKYEYCNLIDFEARSV